MQLQQGGSVLKYFSSQDFCERGSELVIEDGVQHRVDGRVAVGQPLDGVVHPDGVGA